MDEIVFKEMFQDKDSIGCAHLRFIMYNYFWIDICGPNERFWVLFIYYCGLIYYSNYTLWAILIIGHISGLFGLSIIGL